MPNWTSNEVTLTGDPAKRQAFKDAVAGDEGKLDFNKLVPMPKSLDITSGSQTNLGLACWSRKDFDGLSELPWFAEKYPGVRSPAQLQMVLRGTQPETVALGKQALENVQAYGVPTWYEWCIQEWGTKWNASRIQVADAPEALTYRFDTAWDAPRGIVEPLITLAHRLGLSVEWEAEDEGGGSETIVSQSEGAAP